ALDRFKEIVHPSWSSTHADVNASAREAFLEHPLLSGAVFLLASDLPALTRLVPVLPPDLLPQLADLARTRRAFAYGVARAPKAFITLFIAKKPGDLVKVIDAFAVAK